MTHKNLFTPGKLGQYQLPHRVIMAPLTRSRSAQPGDVPQEINVEYYSQRATAALIISEATQISPQGKGYAFTPGIYSAEQIAGWKKVTDSVHQHGGKIFNQLWHVGRVSHSSLQTDNQLPVAPSSIAVEGQAFTYEGMKDFEIPRTLETIELPGIVDQYRQAALNAMQAGFDGVEIHAANGYLLDQFLKDGSNKREDKYGGSIENRIRLTLEVATAVTRAIGSDKVGIRISPTGTFNSMSDSQPQALYDALISGLNPLKLAYLHVVESFSGSNGSQFDFARIREHFNGAYIANGGYTGESAENSIAKGHADFVAFGSLYIANPDLPQRLKLGAPLNSPDPETFYGGAEKGYTDYPALKEELASA